MNSQFVAPQQQQHLFNTSLGQPQQPPLLQPNKPSLPPQGASHNVLYSNQGGGSANLPSQITALPPPPSSQLPPTQNSNYGSPPLAVAANRPPPPLQSSSQMPPLLQGGPQMPPLPSTTQQTFPHPPPPISQQQQEGGSGATPPRQEALSHTQPGPTNNRFPSQVNQAMKPPPHTSYSYPPGGGPSSSASVASRPPLLAGQVLPPSSSQNFPQQPPMMQQQPPSLGNYLPPSTQHHQLIGQMQNMNVDPSARYRQQQYPGVPMIKQQSLPDSGGGMMPPHMPPPLAGQQQFQQQQQQVNSYTNGQGFGPGYPPLAAAVQPMPPAGGLGTAHYPGSYPQTMPYQQNAAAQQKRLDPDQMPSPIQVILDDQKIRFGPFCTNQRGLVPPLVTTKFVVQDQGNASPRFVRSTMYSVPVNQDLMKQSSVPFGLAISPMARLGEGESPPPVANFGELGPVRCVRCKAYMCPYMQFVDSGRRFQCLFCKATTDVPAEYFQHLDHTGQRVDRYERPELVLGTYEFTATKDYCRNNVFPEPPAFVFVIDVSYNNVKSGVVSLLCSQMKDIIRNLPVDQGMDRSNMRVGFITYSSSVHFYNIKGTLAAPQMMVVSDVHDVFMPLLDGFLCTPDESEAIIDQLMEQIPAMFESTRETETILLPAILAGVEALKASNCGGKLLVFHSTLPIAEAPGKLKNRDDRKLLGTEKERTILTPQNQAYNQLGQDCVAAGCCVDLFLFNNAFIDVATIGQVARLSGGQIYKYTYFQADLDGDRLIADVVADVSRPIAFDAIMRVRTSTGVRPTDFYGHFYMSNTTDMELGAIDCDKSVSVEIKHDDKLSEEEGVYLQVALLYTSCSGQRRLRIINLSLKTCSEMADLYRSCDLDTLINFFAKQSLYKILEGNPKAVKDNVTTRAAQILANYRKNCASPSSAGQLILPECMKLLPLYINCLLKSDALSGGSDMTVDDRSFSIQAVITMDVPNSVTYFYPRLFPLHELMPDGSGNENEHNDFPQPMRCSIDRLEEHGVYLLENGMHMLIWIGLNAGSTFCQQVFGVQSPLQIDVNQVTLPELDNPLSRSLLALISKIQSERPRCMRLTLVRQREKLEPIFKHFLVEDRGLDGSPSYVDFLCHMHKEIRTILS